MIATVLVDTNAFTARLRERSPPATSYAKHLFGQRIAVAPQTVAEARYGALSAGWGTARMKRVAVDRPRTGAAGRHRHDRDRRAAAQRVPPDRTRTAPAQPQRRPVDRGHRDPLEHTARRPRRHLQRLPTPGTSHRTRAPIRAPTPLLRSISLPGHDSPRRRPHPSYVPCFREEISGGNCSSDLPSRARMCGSADLSVARPERFELPTFGSVGRRSARHLTCKWGNSAAADTRLDTHLFRFVSKVVQMTARRYAGPRGFGSLRAAPTRYADRLVEPRMGEGV